ncbi:MAG: pilus assembly protein FimV [Gammaproteobacteria bacterium]|jgi:pilus assembly protein FimV|nr:pilus assembly protein FimV [Gammaproteobacteria bacterium]
MFVTLRRLMLMACLLSPSLSWALGLGEIHLNSSLNEPMNAEIDLIAAGPEELTALRATLAAKDAFTRYGIERPPFLSTLTFKVGKSKDGRDVLLVRSSESIPEPFVTFLVEVNWARGRLMREYTVLLDPPVYTPGERASSAAPVAAATTPNAPSRSKPVPATSQAADDSATAPAAGKRAGRSAAGRSSNRASTSGASSASSASSTPSAGAEAAGPTGDNSYRVAQGDTLSKIAHSLRSGSKADVDQTMIAMYRANPDAFGGNINILRRGAVLRVPGGDEIAALNQSEATSEVHRQMDAWRGSAGTPSSGHLRLVTPGAGGGTSTSTSETASSGEAQALKGRVKDLEGQLADTQRLLTLKSNELSELQRKLGTPATQTPAPTPPPTAVTPTPVPVPTPTPPPVETAPSSTVSTAPPPVPTPVQKPAPAKKPVVTAESGSLLDWLQANWWIPAAIILALIAALAFASWRRRQASSGGGGDFPDLDASGMSEYRDPAERLAAGRAGDDSFVVEESGEHPMPQFAEPAQHYGETTADLKAPEDTMSSESPVNLDQGDPLAEADFHMAYGLYDQAADLVRIALEREPDRRDLRLKLLEIYFVWGNKEAFLQTAKGLEATRDRAPVGEWDKIVIMGKQICPDEPMFATTAGSGRGAGALVDLNLEGGENRVDIDLFGDPEGERSLDQSIAKDIDDSAPTGESPHLHAASDLDFTLDRPERGADESPTREMAPRDEPTVESELMNFADSPTTESPALKSGDVRSRIASKLDKVNKADQTAELSIDDLGLDLDHLDGPANGVSEHPADAPTMVAGLDEKSRRMMAEAESRARDKDLTELERELEASFVADLGSDQEEIKTAVLGPESAPTVQMPRANNQETSPTARFKSGEYSDVRETDKPDLDSTSRLRGLNADSIDLDLDRLANALGSGDTVEQPRAEDEVFSTEVFEASQRNRRVDLDVGEALNGSEAAATNKLKTISTTRTTKLKTDETMPELEPVTMSEVGTKLDLARAYMDMGDPEGARSILEEVVTEGSASQKQEAQRLIENLPG